MTAYFGLSHCSLGTYYICYVWNTSVTADKYNVLFVIENCRYWSWPWFVLMDRKKTKKPSVTDSVVTRIKYCIGGVTFFVFRRVFVFSFRFVLLREERDTICRRDEWGQSVRRVLIEPRFVTFVTGGSSETKPTNRFLTWPYIIRLSSSAGPEPRVFVSRIQNGLPTFFFLDRFKYFYRLYVLNLIY